MNFNSINLLCFEIIWYCNFLFFYFVFASVCVVKVTIRDVWIKTLFVTFFYKDLVIFLITSYV